MYFKANKVRIIVFPFLLILFFSNCSKQESSNTPNGTDSDSSKNTSCTCLANDKLRKELSSGKIPALIETNSNSTYEAWSSSLLKASGIAPDIEGEDALEREQSQADYDQWSCMYSAYSLTDGSTKTAWVEGVKGDGIGEVVLAKIDLSKSIKIWSGYGKSEELFFANNRPRHIKVTLLQSTTKPAHAQGGTQHSTIKVLKTFETELLNINGFQSLVVPSVDLATYQNGDETMVYPTFMAIEILSVYKGNKFDDTCISEIENL